MSRDDADSPETEGHELSADETLGRLSLLAEALDPVAPSLAVRSALLDKLHGAERFTPHARRVAERFELALPDVTEALRRICRADAWRPGFWPGSRQLVTDELAAAHTMIAELPAGFHIPHHRHHARELTYVLDGELLENGKGPYGSGTLLELSRGTEHEVSAGAAHPCLVVFGLRFGG
ncbi:MAG: cupin domain-containing protein [Myxococcales bacterium]